LNKLADNAFPEEIEFISFTISSGVPRQKLKLAIISPPAYPWRRAALQSQIGSLTIPMDQRPMFGVGTRALRGKRRCSQNARNKPWAQ
jgi:hypothetical protein